MKKVLSITLYVLAIAAIIFTVVAPSSEALGIPPAVISTGLLIITTIKEIIEKIQKLTPAEAAAFANEAKSTFSRATRQIEARDVISWKKETTKSQILLDKAWQSWVRFG